MNRHDEADSRGPAPLATPRGWMDAVARGLIARAARRAPAELAERLEEEWLADLHERRAGFAQLRFAFGCRWAASVIASEHAALGLASSAAHASASSTGSGRSRSGTSTLAIHAPRGDSPISRRGVVLLAIVALHVGLIYALANGLGRAVIEVIAPPMQGKVFTPERVLDQPPPLPRPDLQRVELKDPAMPDFPVDVPTGEGAITTPPRVVADPTPTSDPVPRVVRRVSGGTGAGFPNTADYYPASAKRADEQGAVIVQACVDPRGRLTAAPAVVETSGYPRLDDGALRLARDASGRYRAPTEDGLPVAGCFDFRVRFTLKP